jgi:isopentenyldiphosphate isomerase
MPDVYHGATLASVTRTVLDNAATSDPGEPLEVYDASGAPTGVAKPRGDVHRDGDWHLAFFCWIVRAARDGLELVLQRRAATKDVWPGRFDASAAGHVRFGETTAEAAREIDEELGLDVDVRDLEALPRHRQEHRHENGLVDRELHDVHLLRCDRPLEDYRPGPEVSGLVSVPLDQLVELATHARDSLATTLVTFDPTGRASHAPLVLGADDLVPYDAAYWCSLRAAAYSAYSGRASIARR